MVVKNELSLYANDVFTTARYWHHLRAYKVFPKIPLLSNALLDFGSAGEFLYVTFNPFPSVFALCEDGDKGDLWDKMRW